ncbi:MAG: hypothetical protein ABSH20_29975, partial [Tepidisphaeraceae bacterium]
MLATIARRSTRQLYTKRTDVQTKRVVFLPILLPFPLKKSYILPNGDLVNRRQSQLGGESVIRIRTTCRAGSVLALVFAALLGPSPCFAADAPQSSTGDNQVWLLSTRDQGSICATMPLAEPMFWKLGPDGQWIPADQKGFAAADDPAVPTVFFIHGNRADRNEAITMGWGVFMALKERAIRPFRLVIWS